MNLHRAGKEGQWVNVPPEDRNIAQNVAAQTNGIVTPANAVSLAGAGVVASGLKDIATGDTTKGVIKVGVGRVFDLADGMVADKTGTKSPIGEGVDVVVDKAEVALALPVLAYKGVLPKPAAGVVFALNVANAAFSSVAKRRGAEIHPSKEGKLAMFGQWMGIGMYGLSRVAKDQEMEKTAMALEAAGHISMIATAALGAKAVLGYAQDAMQEVPPQQNQPQEPQPHA